MKITLLYLNLNQGGVQRMMVNVANYLYANGYDVTVVLCRQGGHYRDILNEGIRMVSLESDNRLSLIRFLTSYLKKEKPDVLFTAVPHLNNIALLSRALARVETRIIISERSNTVEEFNKSPLSAYKLSFGLIPILYRFADAIIAVSKGVADDLSKVALIPRSTISVIYNPAFSAKLLTEANEPVDDPWLANKEHPVIVGVGRLTEQKDFGLLIDAVYQLNQLRPVRLLIIGEGPLRYELQRKIDSYKLADFVRLVGFQSKPTAWINKADVFVLSSKWEGFGNILVEALAAGTTIVSTDCKSGPSEILADGKYGYLVPVSNVPALADAIKYALDNPLPKTMLQERAKEYDVSIVMKKYEKIITAFSTKPLKQKMYGENVY
ncbi:glycosyltransferase [Nibrella viscosa]|uniref:Glycosyltransferase n=1 Tax=Nibrella viscosa TaxID=1084524 RepID=A0ABP8KUD0_9BACT